MATSIAQPLPVFVDDNGAPLDGGYVYIGIQGFEPITNPQAVFWDEALTIPAASATNPLRTKMGFLYRNGAPARAYVADGYSITVKDVNLVTILTDWNVNSGGGVVLGTMAAQNAGTAGSEFRTNAENDARFVLASSYVPTSVQYPNQFKIINGDFAITQRGVGVGNFGNLGSFSADRFRMYGAVTNPAQWEILANTAAVGHLNPVQVLRASTTTQVAVGEYTQIRHLIEDARAYQGQTITIFGWAKRSVSGNICASIVQDFGTGGSPSVAVTTNATANSTVTVGTAFAPFRMVIAVPSVSGKTFGSNGDSTLQIKIWCSAGSNFNTETNSLGLQNAIVDLYGIHERVGDAPIEAINYYQPPDPQAELARCQRYFSRLQNCGQVSSATLATGQVVFPTKMRATPTVTPIYSAGTGTTWVASTTGMYQNAFHSAAARLTQVDLDAEL